MRCASTAPLAAERRQGGVDGPTAQLLGGHVEEVDRAVLQPPERDDRPHRPGQVGVRPDQQRGEPAPPGEHRVDQVQLGQRGELDQDEGDSRRLR